MSGSHPIRSPNHTAAAGLEASTSESRAQGVSMPASASASGGVTVAAVQNVATATLQQPQPQTRTEAPNLQARLAAWEAPRLSLPRDVLVTHLMPFLEPGAAELSLASAANQGFRLAACIRAERLIGVIRHSPGLGRMLAEILEDEERHAALARSALQFVRGGGTFATTNDLKKPVTAVLEEVVQKFRDRVGPMGQFWDDNTLPLYAHLTEQLQSAAPAEASDVQYWKSLLERLFAEELAAEELVGSPASVRSAEDTRVLLRLLDATWEADSVLQDSETRKISAKELNQRANRQERARKLGGKALKRFFERDFENRPERFLDMVQAATSKQPSLRDSIAFWASVVTASKDIPDWEQIALREGSELTRNRALAIAYAFESQWEGLPCPSDTKAGWGFDPELASDPEVACAWSTLASYSLDCITFGDWESHPIRHRNFLLRAVGSEVFANAAVLRFVPDRMLDEDFVKIALKDEEVLFDEDTSPRSYMIIREKIPGFKGSPVDVECLRKLADYRRR